MKLLPDKDVEIKNKQFFRNSNNETWENCLKYYSSMKEYWVVYIFGDFWQG